MTRVEPQNLEAEMAVLGAVLLSGTALPALVDMGLEAKHFYRSDHGLIYTVMREMKAIDPLLLSTALKNRGLLANAGGQANVDLLASSVPAVGHLKHYAQEVMDCWELRSLIRAGHCMIEAAYARDWARVEAGRAWFRGEKSNVIPLRKAS